MQDQEKIDLIIYRVREKGLEVFLPDSSEQPPLQAMQSESTRNQLMANGKLIELDPITDANGTERKAIAVEADWHDLPSLRAMMYEDYRVAKEKAKQRILNLVPDLEKGAFVAVKDALKRSMPEQYAFLKELKDVLTDKNQTKYI
ncbi:MAG: hypothetical protein R2792_16090 [Saprospiraceae bacterium]|jgi:hypothetical protein